MNRTLISVTRKTAAMTAMIALVLAGIGFSIISPLASAQEAETVTVTITKFIDGEQAASETATSSFPMTSTWNDSVSGPGTGTFSLSPGNGFQAVTSAMATGSDYTTSEILTGGVVGATCDATPYALEGYTTGDTFEEAAAGTPSMDIPAFTDMTSDKHVIVWNDDCSTEDPVQVTITKYVDGERATATSTDDSAFNMISSWDDEGNASTGTDAPFTLNSSNDYQAMTMEHSPGTFYTAEEVFDGETVGESCVGTTTTFGFVGYTTGTTLEEAEEATATTTAPSFDDLEENQYVIVWNETCVADEEAELEVREIVNLDTTGTANGEYADGWSYLFRLTLPDDENGVAMRFSDWFNDDDSFSVANNMRISSEQADNEGQPISIVAANTYTTPDLNMTVDLDPLMPGIQVEVLVEVRIPVGTSDGSYITNYGVRSQ